MQVLQREAESEYVLTLTERFIVRSRLVHVLGHQVNIRRAGCSWTPGESCGRSLGSKSHGRKLWKRRQGFCVAVLRIPSPRNLGLCP